MVATMLTGGSGALSVQVGAGPGIERGKFAAHQL
jgi:hypothetical protein